MNSGMIRLFLFLKMVLTNVLVVLVLFFKIPLRLLTVSSDNRWGGSSFGHFRVSDGALPSRCSRELESGAGCDFAYGCAFDYAYGCACDFGPQPEPDFPRKLYVLGWATQFGSVTYLVCFDGDCGALISRNWLTNG